MMDEVIDFFRRVGDAILNIGKVPGKLRRGVAGIKKVPPPKARQDIPEILQGFFERRDASWPEYVIFKLQICLLLLFAVAAFFTIFPGRAPEVIFVPVIVTLAGYAVYITPTQLKPTFKRDYPAYRTFVIMVLIIVSVLVGALRFFSFGMPESPFSAMIPTILIVGSVLVAFAGFRSKYGRNYTFGTVRETKGPKAAIKISYDIRSNVKHGLYFLETLIDVAPGDEVKVGVDRSIWGLRGSEPTVVLEKIK